MGQATVLEVGIHLLSASTGYETRPTGLSKTRAGGPSDSVCLREDAFVGSELEAGTAVRVGLRPAGSPRGGHRRQIRIKKTVKCRPVVVALPHTRAGRKTLSIALRDGMNAVRAGVAPSIG